MPKGHRDGSPRRKHSRKHSKKHSKKSHKKEHRRHKSKHASGRESPEKPEQVTQPVLTGEFELFSYRENAVIGESAFATPDGLVEFTGIAYNLIGSGFDYSHALLEREVLQIRERSTEKMVRECYLSEVNLADGEAWKFSSRSKSRHHGNDDSSSSSESDGSDDYWPTCSPEEFYSRIKRDKNGDRRGRIKAGGWRLGVACQMHKVPKEAVSEREYKRLEKYGHKKAVFLLQSVRLDSRDPRDAEEDEDGEASESLQEDSVSELSEDEDS
jgi:hypothetical protein